MALTASSLEPKESVISWGVGAVSAASSSPSAAVADDDPSASAPLSPLEVVAAAGTAGSWTDEGLISSCLKNSSRPEASLTGFTRVSVTCRDPLLDVEAAAPAEVVVVLEE